MLRKLIHTTDDPVLALLRIALGVIFLAHGCQKMLGWFGGPGYTATLGFFEGMGIPTLLAVLAILAEFLGGIGLIVGFLSRIAGFAIAVNMLVALFLVHLHNGFFMNWTGHKAGEGFEFHLLAISMAVAIAMRGAGAFSLDRALELGPAHRHPYPQPSHG